MKTIWGQAYDNILEKDRYRGGKGSGKHGGRDKGELIRAGFGGLVNRRQEEARLNAYSSRARTASARAVGENTPEAHKLANDLHAKALQQRSFHARTHRRDTGVMARIRFHQNALLFHQKQMGQSA